MERPSCILYDKIQPCAIVVRGSDGKVFRYHLRRVVLERSNRDQNKGQVPGAFSMAGEPSCPSVSSRAQPYHSGRM